MEAWNEARGRAKPDVPGARSPLVETLAVVQATVIGRAGAHLFSLEGEREGTEGER